MWRDFPQRVAEATGCAALVYSRAGYGKSDAITLPRPASFMHDEDLVTLPGRDMLAYVVEVYRGALSDQARTGLIPSLSCKTTRTISFTLFLFLLLSAIV
jgi:hypothetical protein